MSEEVKSVKAVYSNEQTKKNNLKNTLKCVLVLGVIAVVCVALLAIANKFLQVTVTLDRSTSDLINSIAPTGDDDSTAFSSGKIKMVDLSKENYNFSSLSDYNSKYGGKDNNVLAFYYSTDKSGKVTPVVEAEGKGFGGPVVVLVAYNDDKVSGVAVKSHLSETYWQKLDVDAICKKFIGTSGTVDRDSIATKTGATGSLTGIVNAVNRANDFIARLGGGAPKAYAVTNSALIQKLGVVSSASSFTCYPVNSPKVANVYIGDNGDKIVESLGTSGYGAVKIAVRVTEAGKVSKVVYIDNSCYDSQPYANSDALKSQEALDLFIDKAAADISGMDEYLAGSTGATLSNQGLKTAVKNALEYAPQFNADDYAKEGE